MKTDAARCIFRSLKEKADDEQAKQSARYLKMPVDTVLGVRLPDIHKSVNQCTKGVEENQLVHVMRELWQMHNHETRLAAIDVMKKFSKKGDVNKALEIISQWIDDIETWAQMDPLGSNCIGTLLLREPSIEETLRKWASSKNYWRRRASILPYLHLSKKTYYKEEYTERILNAIRPHIDDSEFFVGKAAAWVLREFSKRNPERAKQFVEANKNRMTSLVYREGTKKLEDI